MINHKGFSLIEAMIYLAVTSVGALAMLSMTMTGLRSEMNIVSINDYNNLQDRIKMFISNPNLCPNVLKNTKTSNIDLAGENIGIGTLLSSGSTITLLNIELVGPTTNPNEFSAYINMEGLKHPDALGPNALKPVKIPVTITVDSFNTITSCQLTTNTSPSPIASPTPIVNNPPANQADCENLNGHWVGRGNSGNYYCQL